MRRLYLMTVLALLIQACTGTPELIPTLTPAPSATATAIFAPASTSTITTTPTITPSPTATGFSLPTKVAKIMAGSNSTPTSSVPGPGFLSLTISEKKIYWGSCQPNKTRIVTKVQNPEDVYSVIIFVQVKSAFKEDSTPWTSGNTFDRRDDGTFSYVLSANTTRGHNHYKKSWILFQLVATNEYGEVIGRTKIYTDDISLSPCM